MSDLHPLISAVSHPAPLKGTLPRWRIVLGLVLAPGAFAAQVIVSYALAAISCDGGGASRPIITGVNLLALVVIATGLIVSAGNFRRTRGEGKGGHRKVQSEGDGRTRFLAYFGLCASIVFALAVIVQLTSLIILHRCLGLPTLP
ncbi:hypothetical protein [Novosphingobium sp. Gsoil 351]|uniref:hypothetical protein n=1 Tax=Novosphingobium sp. Gsoil 351 TaxID=2675225 RepID=UPI0012B4870F|nr:hypothetical protein [Novosphingobium sp. Gsoil 351]QGN54130.1 hypothetical protein GKE62_05795 [Novosphingobium sp. Gsoil 351]